MECELVKGSGGQEPLTKQVATLEDQVKVATDKLLLANFPACFEICQQVVTVANGCCEMTDSTDAMDRLQRVREEATVVGVQALAEKGAWRDVVPFVEQAYVHIAACPARIMQMCLLLHAQVGEYLVCHWLVNRWLEEEAHCCHPHCPAVVTAYVNAVLVPLGAFNLIPQVVDRCLVLTPEQKQSLLSPQMTPSPPPRQGQDLLQVGGGDLNSDSHLPSAIEQSAEEASDAVDPEQEARDVDDRNSWRGYRFISLYMHLVRKLWRHLARKGWWQQIMRASKLFFFLSLVFLALLHVQTDVTAHLSRALPVWRWAVQALQSVWRQQPAK